MSVAVAVVEPEVMRLRRPKQSAAPSRRQIHYKIRDDLRPYLGEVIKDEEEAFKTGALLRKPRDQSDVINDALAMERDLETELGHDADRMDTWAAGHGLDMDRNLAKVIAQLVRRGLDALEAEQAAGKHPKKK